MSVRHASLGHQTSALHREADPQAPRRLGRSGASRAVALASAIGLAGCNDAPSQTILGSYFPSWMLCALVGIGAAVVARLLFVAAGPRPDAAGATARLSGTDHRLCLRGVAAMAGLAVRVWLGRLIAVLAIVSAVGLGAYALDRIDHEPRTHDAFLYADSAGLAPEVSGRIVAINVRDNQRVRRGDSLVEIDPEPFELRLRQARAEVAALRAQIDLTTRQVAAQSSGADAAATQIQRARAQLALARDTLGRLLPLLTKGYVTQQQVDEARTSERTAGTALIAATQQARQARQAVGDTDSLVAQLAGAEATVALAERDLRNTTLRAPFDGLVVGLDIASGAYAVAGHPLFTLIKAQPWYAIGNFRETDLPQIAVRDKATVWMMADGSHPIAGTVESVGWGVRPDDGGGPLLPAVGRTLSWVVVAQRFPVTDPARRPARGGDADRRDGFDRGSVRRCTLKRDHCRSAWCPRSCARNWHRGPGASQPSPASPDAAPSSSRSRCSTGSRWRPTRPIACS